MSKVIDLVGQRFGRLTVIGRAENDKYNHARWHCMCDCGNASVAWGSNLKKGRTLSCGCLKVEKMGSGINKKHGMKNHPLYSIYTGMRGRCYSVTNKAYANYGGRGISVCDEWLENPVIFFEWAMTNGWEPGLTIERTDNDGGYSPDNCKWATITEQNRNKRNVKKVTFNGEERLLCDLIRESGLNEAAIRKRVESGWSIDRALTEAVKGKQSRLHVAST